LTALASGIKPSTMPSNFLPFPRARRKEFVYFSASDDWSTVTPGPMVELTEIFCR
jgi:hypothetical protein